MTATTSPCVGLAFVPGWRTIAEHGRVRPRLPRGVSRPPAAGGLRVSVRPVGGVAAAGRRGAAAGLAPDIPRRGRCPRPRAVSLRRPGDARQSGPLGRSARGPPLPPGRSAPSHALGPDGAARAADRLRGPVERRPPRSDRARHPPGRRTPVRGRTARASGRSASRRASPRAGSVRGRRWSSSSTGSRSPQRRLGPGTHGGRARCAGATRARRRPGPRGVAEPRGVPAVRSRAAGHHHDRRRASRVDRRGPSTGRGSLRRTEGRGIRVRTRATARPHPCPWCPGSGSTARGASRRACCGPGRRSRLAAERCEDVQVRWTTLAMAALATTALDQAVLEPGRSRALRPGRDRRRARRPGARRRLVSRQAPRSLGRSDRPARVACPRTGSRSSPSRCCSLSRSRARPCRSS